MFYNNISLITLFLFLTNCTTGTLVKKKPNSFLVNAYSNKGFALVYNEDIYKKKIVNKKIDDRSLIIFQKNLKNNTQVKITNILNNKSLVAQVGGKSIYPSFNNSVLSLRIVKELDLDVDEPYIEIVEIFENSIFVSKKAKTYDEERIVAIKVPVKAISINNLNEVKTKNKKKNHRIFSYKIKIADFYFEETAIKMTTRIIRETLVKYPKIKKISEQKYRVYLGPFKDINSLQKSYNDIEILAFENIEIINND
jgi:hypothetical protein